jgi:DNA excision repair protein ERCC-2
MDEFFKKINFPYSSVRAGQDKFIKKVFKAIPEHKNIMVCAPTGLGKTISGLAPAIYQAKKNKLTVVCLTSRQTQANQVIKTIKDINSVSKEKINYVAFIGKRNMCAHPDKSLYPPQDFNEFCKKMREEGRCKYFMNTKNEEYAGQVKAILDESSNSFMSVEGFVNLAGTNNFCPYELAGRKGFHADVVVCDFNYMFASGIRESFLGKIGRDIDECILVVDEAHNLPDRIRNAYSYTLSTEMIKNAIKELKDFVKTSKYDCYIKNIDSTIRDIYVDKLLGDKSEYLLESSEFLELFMKKFKKGIEFNDILEKLKDFEMLVKEERVVSHIGRVANFLEKWHELDNESFLRTLEKNIKKDKTVLSLKIICIDPSDISQSTLNNSFSSILMSATLFPINMYKDILGVRKCEMLELESPFSKKNQLTLAINDVTTKYSARTPEMYKKIAKHIEQILNSASNKNAIIFFPSYYLMDTILEYVKIEKLQRKILKEIRYMSKEEKENFVDKFKENENPNEKAKVLFAITSGSFAEGLDLPAEMLEMVVVVGLPLSVPNLFTKSVIRHFDKKFGKGQMYGYIHPAMNKIIQAGGRCIRTENDKGVIVLLDNRFLWTLYAQCFPRHWKLKKADDYRLDIGNFFE